MYKVLPAGMSVHPMHTVSALGSQKRGSLAPELQTVYELLHELRKLNPDETQDS